MNLRWIDSKGVSERDLSELPALRKRTDGFLWLDIPKWSEEAEALFGNEFHFRPMAISKSRSRNHVAPAPCVSASHSMTCQRRNAPRARRVPIQSVLCWFGAPHVARARGAVGRPGLLGRFGSGHRSGAFRHGAHLATLSV